MSLEKAIIQVLMENTGNYPGITDIAAGTHSSSTKYFIRVTTQDPEFIDAGQCFKQPVRQEAHVVIIGTIGRDDDDQDIQEQVETLATQVKTTLKANGPLTSTLYPSGFALRVIFKQLVSDFDMLDKDQLYYADYPLDVEYFQ